MAENVKTQKFTVRHFLVLFTCMICIFTSSAITFSCPGLAYRPVAMQLGIQVSDVSLYMSFVYLFEVIFSPIVGALLEKFDVRIIACRCFRNCCIPLHVAVHGHLAVVHRWCVHRLLPDHSALVDDRWRSRSLV